MSLALAGALSLFAALAAHEILIFGPRGHDIIGQDGCPQSLCPDMTAVIIGLLAKAIGAGLALALLGAIVPMNPARMRGAALLWAAQYLWALLGIASAYRIHFGTTWRWWEPFVGLMWHPLLTPALLLAGLAVFLGIDRLLAPRTRLAGS